MAFLHFLPEIFYRGAAVQNIAHMAFRQPIGGKIFIDAFRNIRLAMDKIFRDDRQMLGNGNHCIDRIGRKIIFNDGFFFHCVINRRAVAGDNIAQKGQCLDCLWHCAEGSACGRHKINALFVHLFQRMI